MQVLLPHLLALCGQVTSEGTPSSACSSAQSNLLLAAPAHLVTAVTESLLYAERHAACWVQFLCKQLIIMMSSFIWTFLGC